MVYIYMNKVPSAPEPPRPKFMEQKSYSGYSRKKKEVQKEVKSVVNPIIDEDMLGKMEQE